MTKLPSFFTLLLLLLSSGARASTPSDTLTVVFWNLENFFDYHSASRPAGWNRRRFDAKCNSICKTLLDISGASGSLPDIVGFAEVENRYVLSSLLSRTLLRKAGYSIVHYESPDHRGIDCALLYRKDRMRLLSSEPKHLCDSLGSVIATRDILLSRFENLSVLVNHHPSKLGSGKDDLRRLAFQRMENLADSLIKQGSGGVLCIGDFNDDLWTKGDKLPDNQGTIKFNSSWEKIDGFFCYGQIEVQEKVFDAPYLLEKDKKWGGLKPRRTFIGPRYNAGVSDHLPIVLKVYLPEVKGSVKSQ